MLTTNVGEWEDPNSLVCFPVMPSQFHHNPFMIVWIVTWDASCYLPDITTLPVTMWSFSFIGYLQSTKPKEEKHPNTLSHGIFRDSTHHIYFKTSKVTSVSKIRLCQELLNNILRKILTMIHGEVSQWSYKCCYIGRPPSNHWRPPHAFWGRFSLYCCRNWKF